MRRIPEAPSPYYPPRARWHTRLREFGWRRGQRARQRWKGKTPGVTLARLLLALFIPGLGFYWRGHPRAAFLTMAGILLLAMLFLYYLGQLAGNLAFGLLLSVHAVSLNFYLDPLVRGRGLQARLAFALVILVMMGGLVYLPARRYLERRWFLPLRIAGRVVVVRRVLPEQIHRGDQFVFRYQGGRGQGWVVRSGLAHGEVLAIPGDTVTFRPGWILVNQRRRPSFPGMPSDDGLVVRERQWFTWPQLEWRAGRRAVEGDLTSELLRVGAVGYDQLVGKLCDHWFGRKQTL